MSFDFRTVKEPSNDPVLKYIAHLSKALSKSLTKGLIDQLDSSEDIFGDVQDVEAAIKFQTDLNYSHKFLFNKDYYPPNDTEQKLVLWVRGRNMGSTMTDFAAIPNVPTIHGEPILVSGNPFDHGCYDESTIKSLALRLNRPTSSMENEEFIKITPVSSLKVQDISTGISYFMRFRLKSLTTQGSLSRTLFAKVDNVSGAFVQNGAMIIIHDDGRICFQIAKSGISQRWKTNAGTITTDTVYDVWCTYAVSGNVMHIYINNVDMALNATAEESWQGDLTNNDISIFRRGFGSNGGYVYGDFYDLKIYREKVVSATEVGYHWTNKLSISNIPFGQVIVANHWATKTTLESSFTTTSYTTTSFTAG